MLSKSQVVNLMEILAVGSMTAIGFAIGNPIATEAIKGIGLNLASNLVQSGSAKLKENWFSSVNGILNHDVQQAFVRAFVEASNLLETEYFRENKDVGKSEKWAIEYLFGQFRQQSFEVFLISADSAISETDLKTCLYAGEQTAQAIIWSRIETLLATYSPDLKNFLRENLLKTVVFCFGEELKKDNEQGRRAWRAFQRLMLEGISSELKNLNAGQELIQRDLGKLNYIANDIQLLNHYVRHELIDSLGADLKIIKDKISGMDTKLDEIRGLVGNLKPQREFDEFEFRTEYNEALHRVLKASSSYELNSVRHQIKYLEDKYPNKQEIYFLKDKFERANRYETTVNFGAPQMSKSEAQKTMSKNMPTQHSPTMNYSPQKSSSALIFIVPIIVFVGLILAGLVFLWWWLAV